MTFHNSYSNKKAKNVQYICNRIEMKFERKKAFLKSENCNHKIKIYHNHCIQNVDLMAHHNLIHKIRYE